MKKIGENNMIWDEIFYYRQKNKPDRSYWDKEKRKVVYYTEAEIAEKLKELYDKMIDAKKIREEKPSEEKEKAESNPKIKYTKEERKKHWEEKHPNQIAKEKKTKEKKKKEPEPSAEETTKINWFHNNQKKDCEFLWKDE
jgi:hypothetical protein